MSVMSLHKINDVVFTFSCLYTHLDEFEFSINYIDVAIIVF